MNALTDPRSLRPMLHLSPAPRPARMPEHDARALTGPDGLACILLDGQAYTLRITRQGKLILTK